MSDASNLNATQTQGVYVRDVEHARTLTASLSSSGRPANDYSDAPEITPDGRRVLFHSYAQNLTPPRERGLFIRDIRLRKTTWAAPATVGSMSDDGRYVAFTQRPADCLPRWRTDCLVVRVADQRTSIIQTVSVTSEGALPNNGSSLPTLSGSGRYVAFTSMATDLVPNDNNLVADVFVADRETGRIVLVSRGPALQEANGASGGTPLGLPGSAISGNGHWLVYTSKASNLVADDTNGVPDLFVRDWDTGLFG